EWFSRPHPRHRARPARGRVADPGHPDLGGVHAAARCRAVRRGERRGAPGAVAVDLAAHGRAAARRPAAGERRDARPDGAAPARDADPRRAGRGARGPCGDGGRLRGVAVRGCGRTHRGGHARLGNLAPAHL
ncbi:MAG: hypothetical protein AVDCRST_MAG13-2222, partial [uncultured Solirubrobacteraceae bacterium]